MKNDERAKASKAALERIRARAKAGTLKITYGGRDGEIEYLRGAIAKEQDEEIRVRMQKRLAHVEAHTEAELMRDFLEPE